MPAPARVCTTHLVTVLRPARATEDGTMPTRYSWFLISLGTPEHTSPDANRPALSSAAETMATELASFRRDMLRFAVLQLRDPQSAEDAVQETMLAALQGAARFAERAKLKTWVFSILRNKIVDIIRRRVREPIYEAVEQEIDDADFDPLFKSNGHWQRDARAFGLGESGKEFRKPQLLGRSSMPACSAAASHRARLHDARNTRPGDQRNLQELSMSTSNCWVVLHRARMGLRLCLEQKWFGSEERGRSMTMSDQEATNKRAGK
jgi:RNA polymerase sigma-70 factor (ECF subfamily)